MNRRLRKFLNYFYPMYGMQVAREEENQNDAIFNLAEEEIRPEDRLRDWAAIQGYMGRSKQEAWQVAESEILANMPPELEVAEPQTNAQELSRHSQLQKERLEALREETAPRLEMAHSQADSLRRHGFTPNGASIMVWIGWLCVAALGWVFTWIIQRVIEDGNAGPTAVNDILGLFVRAFATLHNKIVSAFPAFVNYEWLVLAVSLVMVLIAIVAYLRAQSLSGMFKSIEVILDVVSQGMAKPEKTRLMSPRNLDDEIARRKTKWLIIAIVFALPGLGILLSSLEAGYSISIIFMGFVLAMLAVAVMTMVIHVTLNPDSWSHDGYFPKWLIKAIVTVTISLVAVLFLCLLLISFGGSPSVAKYLAVATIGCFLLGGTAVLALGQFHNNIFKEEKYWIHLRGQLERRIRHLHARAEKLQAKAESKERERAIEAEKHKAGVRQALQRFRRIYEEAYNLGQTAYELQKNRMAQNNGNHGAKLVTS